MNLAKRFIHNTFWNYLNFGLITVTGLISSVVLVRYLGQENYGTLGYVGWFTSIVTLLLSIGLPSAISKYLPKFYFSGELNQAKLLVNKILIATFVVAISAAILLSLNLDFILGFVNIAHPDLRLMLLIATIMLIPNAVNAVLGAVLYGIQEFKAQFVISVVGRILHLVSILVLLLLNAGLIWFVVMSFVSVIVSVFLSVVALRSFYSTKGKDTGKTNLKQVGSFAFYSYINILLISVVWDKSEIFFLGLYSNASSIAIYSLGYSLAALMLGLINPALNVVNTVIPQLVGSNRIDQLRVFAGTGTKYLAFFMIPLYLYASFFSSYVVGIMYGPKFLEVGTIFSILFFSQMLAVVFNPVFTVPYFREDHRKVVLIAISAGAFNILLDILLIPKFDIYGAAYANLSAQMLSLGLSILLARRHGLGIFNSKFFLVLFLNLMSAGILSGLFLVSQDFLVRLVGGVLALMGYLWIGWRVLPTAKDLKVLDSFANALPGKLSQLALTLTNKIANRFEVK